MRLEIREGVYSLLVRAAHELNTPQPERCIRNAVVVGVDVYELGKSQFRRVEIVLQSLAQGELVLALDIACRQDGSVGLARIHRSEFNPVLGVCPVSRFRLGVAPRKLLLQRVLFDGPQGLLVDFGVEAGRRRVPGPDSPWPAALSVGSREGLVDAETQQAFDPLLKAEHAELVVGGDAQGAFEPVVDGGELGAQVIEFAA